VNERRLCAGGNLFTPGTSRKKNESRALGRFIFPLENMPLFARALSYLNPLRYFMIVIREIFIKGAHLNQLYWQGFALVIFSGVIFSFAVLRFQQRIK